MRLHEFTSSVVVRKNTVEELQYETDEYFDNPAALSKFPNVFTTKEQMTAAVLAAPMVPLHTNKLLTLENSDVATIMQSKTPIKDLFALANEYDRDVVSILNAIKHNQALPAPIVFADAVSCYLIAGNTRLMAAAALEKSIPVAFVVVRNKTPER